MALFEQIVFPPRVDLHNTQEDNSYSNGFRKITAAQKLKEINYKLKSCTNCIFLFFLFRHITKSILFLEMIMSSIKVLKCDVLSHLQRVYVNVAGGDIDGTVRTVRIYTPGIQPGQPCYYDQTVQISLGQPT